ncbi:MAG: peptidylprolyl isomerase [Xanthomonadaceae bacterium]|nr:peptidylprolyl isomerase [Xanthomonadaceae bacterium]MDP2184984.1 peptidylprolyl isomerase [Xanthomonadales bacterium]MDZ4117335.1 peptidylprolyl isomerase [Xanthomonadaceae bacterium]MDZ4377666.1 peptidylprolyl isomerase [Xanthomonadaceae bacterium]
MQIEDNHVVRFHYSVTPVGEPEATESSFDGEPVAVLIGHGNIIPGLEQALKGRQVDDRFEVTVPAEQAYGERRADMSQRIPKKYFAAAATLRPGQQTQVSTRFGPRAVTVIKVGLTSVDVDLNHPLAGQSLHFDVQVVEVRGATDEEIAHRHVHGEGGHAHD